MMRPQDERIDFGARADEATRLLKLLANEKRLHILCELANHREMSVTDLSEAIDLGQSALSQHLARMRAEGLLAFRRDAQTVYYRIANPDADRILALLKDIFCDPPREASEGSSLN